MAVSFIGSQHGNGGVSTVTSLSIIVPAGAIAGDLAIINFGNERGSVLPTITAPTSGVQIGVQIGSTNIGHSVAWKRLTSGDIGGTIVATWSSTRGVSGGVTVLRGAADPVFVNGALFDAGGAASGVITCPSATPATDDSMLMGVISWSPVAAPFTRTLTPAAGWAEDYEATSGNGTALSGHTTVARKQLTGGSAVSQTGYVATPSDVSTHMAGYTSTVVIAPLGGSNTPPTADAGPDQTAVEPWSTVTLSGAGTDSDGTIASYLWRQVSGTTVTLSSTTVASPTFVAPAAIADATLVFGLKVTDNDGAQSTEDTVSITILAATEYGLSSGGVWQPMQIVAL